MIMTNCFDDKNALVIPEPMDEIVVDVCETSVAKIERTFKQHKI